jgi:hypothetical protein
MTFKEWMLAEGGRGSGGFSLKRLVKGTFRPARPHFPHKNKIKIL